MAGGVGEGRLVLPSAPAERAETRRVCDLKRDLLSCDRAPAALIMNRFYPYFDELSTDLGVDTVRGGGVLASYLAPLNPDWYVGVGTEAARRSRLVYGKAA